MPLTSASYLSRNPERSSLGPVTINPDFRRQETVSSNAVSYSLRDTLPSARIPARAGTSDPGLDFFAAESASSESALPHDETKSEKVRRVMIRTLDVFMAPVCFRSDFLFPVRHFRAG